jgi:hypothetical protein
MRYMAQPCGTSCGPTVAVNALKWAGVKATREKTLPKAKKGMKWVPNDGGCFSTNIRQTIRKMGRGKIILHWNPATPAVVMEHIQNGGAALIELLSWDKIHHICLVVKGDSGWLPYKIINGHLVSYTPTEHGITERSFRRILRKHSTTSVHLISKVEEDK